MTTKQFDQTVTDSIQNLIGIHNKAQIPAEALQQMEREGWASMDEQRRYWEERDANLDRIEATCEHYDQQGKVWDGEDIEDWQRQSERQGTE